MQRWLIGRILLQILEQEGINRIKELIRTPLGEFPRLEPSIPFLVDNSPPLKEGQGWLSKRVPKPQKRGSSTLSRCRIQRVEDYEERPHLDDKNFGRYLRANMTTAEIALWLELANLKADFRFSRQIKVCGCWVDFCCRRLRVVIEVDGASHEQKIESDQQRDAKLSAAGYLVLRFTNQEVSNAPRRVVESIRAACESRPRVRY
jgi:very-short-patch-repair endonuclease